jgi:transcriptional regulator with XRE-family HTH domain
VNFHLLQTRLVAEVRARVRNGEISERGLARLSGISQPHIHNVLKGTRLLSLYTADRILRHLRIDLADLLTAEDGDAPRPRRPHADAAECRAVALLDGWIGPEHPFPHVVGRERYPFMAADVERLESPVAARLAPSPRRAPIFSGSGVVLLERAEAVRLEPDEEGYFALDLPSGGAIGAVRRGRRHLYLKDPAAEAWQPIPVPERGPLDVIQGRVSVVVRQL